MIEKFKCMIVIINSLLIDEITYTSIERKKERKKERRLYIVSYRIETDINNGAG